MGRARAAKQHMVIDAEVVDGLVHAWTRASRARPAGRDGAADRRSDPPRRPRALLALADDPPQPDQLVRGRLRRRRASITGKPAAPAPRPARAARAVPRRGAGAAGPRGQPRPGLALPLLPASGRGRTATNFDSAEYANIVALLHALLRAARGSVGMARAAGRGRAPAATLAEARAGAATGRTRAT